MTVSIPAREQPQITTPLGLLEQLLDEGIQAAAGFHLAKLEQLISQQESALRALSTHAQGATQAGGMTGSLLRLRRRADIFSRVLLNTSQTVSALAAATQAAALEPEG
jgi:hypothetical protein